MKRMIQGLKVDLSLLREWFYEWLEWQDAKEWAKCYHPGWVQIARKAKHKHTRDAYRRKIVSEYRGEECFVIEKDKYFIFKIDDIGGKNG